MFGGIQNGFLVSPFLLIVIPPILAKTASCEQWLDSPYITRHKSGGELNYKGKNISYIGADAFQCEGLRAKIRTGRFSIKVRATIFHVKILNMKRGSHFMNPAFVMKTLSAHTQLVLK